MRKEQSARRAVELNGLSQSTMYCALWLAARYTVAQRSYVVFVSSFSTSVASLYTRLPPGFELPTRKGTPPFSSRTRSTTFGDSSLSGGDRLISVRARCISELVPYLSLGVA